MYDVYHCIVFVYTNMINYHDTQIFGHLHLPTTSWNSSQNNIRYHVIIWKTILTAVINPDSSEVYFEIMLIKEIYRI